MHPSGSPWVSVSWEEVTFIMRNNEFENPGLPIKVDGKILCSSENYQKAFYKPYFLFFFPKVNFTLCNCSRGLGFALSETLEQSLLSSSETEL